MSNERRRFFRIDDIVGLKTRVIAKQDIEQTLNSFWNDQHQFSIRNEFNYKLDQHQADLQHIKNKMPELGRYLSVLQEQLDLLTDKMVDDRDGFTTRETAVNISAQGISFISDEKFQAGDIIELNLLLLPSKQKIVIFGKAIAIDCQQDDKKTGTYSTSIDFEHMHDADRELLVKHVHAKQLRSLGAAQLEESS